MSAPLPPEAMVGVVGAGAMGAGIAQVAARAGHRVVLVDANPAAVTAALARTGDDLGRLVERGKLAPADRAACLARMHAGTGSGDLADAALVIEAIVERLDAKIGLLRDLEAVVGPETILATNTSSLSVTAIAAGLSRPERCAGFHFFNPAPVMRLVEVVPGAQTDSAIAHTLKATAERWGKVAVFAKSTPGFIVNRVARPFYGEALRLLEEQICDAATLDALFVEGAGFRMGPCELMDLIGHDVNFAVTRSVFEACFHDPRYRPSQLQRDLVDAGWLGRKAGRGFFHYRDGREKPSPKSEFGRESAAPLRLPEPGAGTMIGRTWLTCSDGRPAALVAEARKGPVVLHDLVRASGSRVGLAASPDVPAQDWEAIVSGLAAGGLAPTLLADRPGLVVLRTLAMLANEAFEAELQGIASFADIDAAMLNGLNFPVGPAAWAHDHGFARVLSALDAIHAATGDPRYRASLRLRLAAVAA